MKIAFRCDASKALGTGHVYRCLTLADALTAFTCDIRFVILAHEDNLAALIEQRGYACLQISSDFLSPCQLGETRWQDYPQGQDWHATKALFSQYQWQPDMLLVDHYSLSARWESLANEMVETIAVIDDLANRRHQCQFLLDQTLGRQAAAYQALVSPTTRLCMGGQYSLLRPEFAAHQQKSLDNKRNKQAPDSLLIAMGGADADNATLKILQGMAHLTQLSFSLLLGPLYAHREALNAFIRSQPDLRVNVFQGVTNVAEILTEQDLAIGASGASSWERMALAVPTLLYTLAPNQSLIAEQVEAQGAGLNMGPIQDFSSELLTLALESIINDNKRYQALVTNCATAINAQGAQKAARALFELTGIT